jgi:two-component system response regulator
MNAPSREIVLVDDDADEVAVALRAFRRAGLDARLRVLRDGAEAIEWLVPTTGDAPSRPRPAAVLLDLRMPRADGLEVLRRLRADARTADLPVVVVSSSGREEDVRAAYRAGANSYVRKRADGVDPGVFLIAAARYWLELNEAPP